MSLIKCNKCGEMFSDSYKTCPFCLEDEEYYHGKVKKRGHRQMEQKKKTPSAVGPVLLLVVVLLVAGLVWAFAGDTVKGWFGGEKDDAPITDQQPNKPDASTDKPDDSQTPENTALTLDRMTLLLAPGESQKLTASGGSDENYRWIPGDESIAKLADDGTVTAVAEGTTTITVICGDESVACAVTVQKKADVSANTDGNGDSSTATKPNTTTKPDTSTKPDSSTGSSGTTLKNLKIKTMYGTELGKNPDGQFDMTINRNDPPCELTLEGVSGTAKWKSSDTSVVKVSSDGTLERVGSGTATVTITVGSGTAEILVRVN